MDAHPDLDPALLDLLVEWEERTTVGDAPTPEELCGGDAALADGLRRYIRRVHRVDRLLAVTTEDVPPSLPGFELLGAIGRGGMGTVYRARDLTLDWLVAVKIPHADAAPAVAQDRFRQEARTLARLSHPGIVPIHAAGIVDGGPYFVMELVTGGSLAERKAELRADPARTALLLAQVARAVEYAHGIGFVHRDLKPSNILIDGRGNPVVSDFGVASLLAPQGPEGAPAPGGPGSEPHRGCHTSRAVGTPAYAAPELLGREPGRASPASDIWSLGVIAYELLVGRLPYKVEHGSDGWKVEPSLRLARTGLDRGLEGIVRKCLAPDPRDRYGSALQLATALEAWRRRRVRWRRAKRVGWAAALVLAVLASAVSTRISSEERQANHLRQIHERIQRGEKAQLVPGTGRPVSYRVRVGDARTVRTSVNKDGTFAVDNSAREPALIELLEDARTDNYRFSVWVREDRHSGGGWAGLYYAHQVVPTNEPVHVFGRLQFPALGPETTRMSVASLTHCCLTPPGTTGDCWVTLAGGARIYPPQDPPGEQWHRLTVEVTEHTARAWFDEVELEPPVKGTAFRFDDINFWARTLPSRVPALASSQALESNQVRVMPRGGLGLYLSDCRASFRNGWIEPLGVTNQGR